MAVYPRLVRDAVYTISGNRLRELQFSIQSQSLQRGSGGTICVFGAARPLCLDKDATAAQADRSALQIAQLSAPLFRLS